MNSSKAIGYVERALRARMVPLGFRPERPHGFRKDVGDVRWYVGVMSHPRSSPGTVAILAEVSVFSEPLELKSPRLPPKFWDWGAGHVRASLPDLAGVGTAQPAPPWQVSAEEDLDAVAKEIVEAVLTAGITFLEQIKCTDDMIPFLRSGKYSLGLKRSNYDADVWQGITDPTKNPWTPPKRAPHREYTIDEYIAEFKAEQEARRLALNQESNTENDRSAP